MNGEPAQQIAWDWPFSRADLTAGLRRWKGDGTIQVRSVRPITLVHRRPSVGRVRAMVVEYEGRKGRETVRLVVKEPWGATRTGLAGAGRREVGVYQWLAGQIPLGTPAFLIADDHGDWLILEAFQVGRDAANWTAEDYRQAIEGLAGLHDRFWGLGQDLHAYPWLSRPLEADFEVHVAAAAKAIERMVQERQPAPLAGSPERMQVLARLTTEAERVVAPLRQEPMTLLHGDYWPGNIASLQDGRQLVFDWQHAAVGPGVLDLLVFVNKSAWWFDRRPLSEGDLVRLYREAIARRTGHRWSEARWSLVWDHALMWRFLQEWVDVLAASPNPVLEMRAEELDRVWLGPVSEAVERRLGRTAG